jgi:hypothetical protein
MFEPHENETRSAKLASRDAKRARKRFAKNSLERKKFPKRDGCWPCKLTKKKMARKTHLERPRRLDVLLLFHTFVRMNVCFNA